MANRTSVKQPDNGLWGVRGVEMETRNAAKMAARRAEQSLGAWVNRVLREAATTELTGKATDRTPAPTLEQTVARLLEEMQRQREEAATRHEQDTARLAAIEEAAQEQRREAAVLHARLDAAEQERQRLAQEQESARRRSILARLFGVK